MAFKKDEFYMDRSVTLKRQIIMDMLHSLFANGKNTSVELWKLHIDAALDQLDESVYTPILRTAQIELLEQLEGEAERMYYSNHTSAEGAVPLQTIQNLKQELQSKSESKSECKS